MEVGVSVAWRRAKAPLGLLCSARPGPSRPVPSRPVPPPQLALDSRVRHGREQCAPRHISMKLRGPTS